MAMYDEIRLIMHILYHWAVLPPVYMSDLNLILCDVNPKEVTEEEEKKMMNMTTSMTEVEGRKQQYKNVPSSNFYHKKTDSVEKEKEEEGEDGAFS